MQAAIAKARRTTIATPFGRSPVLKTARVSRLCASTQARLAAPRLVTNTKPSSATTPAAAGKPAKVARCLPAS
jgi:hypothetical protein